MTNSGYNSSRLGFRGVEDMGGGLQAGFWIEGALSNDDGNAAGMNWQRRSTVSLMGGFGEIRLGRDYTPSFWNTTVYDPFGTNGVGQRLIALVPGNRRRRCALTMPSAASCRPWVASRQVMYAFGENVSGGAKTNNYLGFRFGYAAGPVSVHAAYAKVEGATDAADVKDMNIAGSFDAGVVKATLVYAQEKNGAGAKATYIEPGIQVPLGAGMFKATYGRYDLKDSSNDFNKIALGYHYNMSKRTVLYTTYARISNKGASAAVVSNNGLAIAGAAGRNASGFEFGVRHAF
jgi:predicted porin